MMMSKSSSARKPPSVITISRELTDTSLAKIRHAFPTVHYYPDLPSTSASGSNDIPSEVLETTEIWLSDSKGLPECIKDIKELPRLQHLQLLSAGADKCLRCPAISNHLTKSNEGANQLPFSISTASGVHAVSIAQYVVGCILGFVNHLFTQALWAKTEARWAQPEELVTTPFDPHTQANGSAFQNYSLRKKTVGILGYGAIGRETARQLKAFGCTIIAANTSGERRTQDGFAEEGTGDPEGSIPSRCFSSTEPKSLDAFLSECDILVSILPSTPSTRSLLDARRLSLLKPNGIFVNVGRGDLVQSDAILTALERPGGLLGVALDVTDPEPLPDNHPLWRHPRVLVTSHLSGDAEGEFDLGVEILLENVKRLREGTAIVNRVDLRRQY